MNRPRKRKHFTARLSRQPRGNQRAGLRRRFNHQRALCKTRNQAVALRKVRSARGRAKRPFGHDCTRRGNLLRKRMVTRRIDKIDARAHHRDGARTALKRALMRCAVDSQRQSRHNAQARIGQRARKLRRILKPLGTCMTASHYRKRGHMEFRQAAAYIQHRRRVGDFKQGARICRVGERHEMMVGCKRPFHRAHMDCIMTVVIARMQNCLRALLAYCMRERGIGLPENLLRQSKGCQQAAHRYRPKARSACQTQPGFNFILSKSEPLHHEEESLLSLNSVCLLNSLQAGSPFSILMALLNILCYPDPRLHTVAQPVAEVDARIRQLIRDMAETMYAAPGIGLAATQVNVHQRVMVIDVSDTRDQLQAFINPELTETSAQTKPGEEGCLSVPGIYDTVERSERIRLRALNEEGKAVEIDANGLLAVCIQHEVDHLNGKVFVDYLSALKRMRIKTKMKKRAHAR